jgi:hypothetical protein
MMAYIQQLVGAFCLVLGGYTLGYRHATKRCQRIFLATLDQLFDEVLLPGLRSLVTNVIRGRSSAQGLVHAPPTCTDPNCQQCKRRRPYVGRASN